MEQRNSSTSVADNSTPGFATTQQKDWTALREGDLVMHLPLRYAGGNLGFGFDKLYLTIEDANASHFVTESIEWILRNVEHFVERHKVQLLAGAALHFDLDVYALMGRDIEATRQLHREGKLG